MDEILLLIRLFLAALFALAGIGKLLDPMGSRKVMTDFGVPERFAGSTAIGLSVLEIVIAAALIPVSTSWLAAIAALILLLAFIGGMLFHLARGETPDCHCFGQFHSEPVGTKSIVRNIIFAVLALFLTAQGRENQGASLSDGSDVLTPVIGVVIIALMAAGIVYLRRIAEQLRALQRSIEILQLTSGEGVTREDAGSLGDHLPIGGVFPDFELADLRGGTISLADIQQEGKHILLIFAAPTCGPCRALVPEFEAWQSEIGDRIKIVLISTGKLDENRQKFGGSSIKTIAVEDRRELAERVHARWTPTAIFVSPEGRILSRPAIGDAAIRELYVSVRAAGLDNEYLYFANGDMPELTAKIGERVPEFAIRDLDGNEHSPSTIQGKKTLLTFWSPTCPHCRRMMDDLRHWDLTKSPDDPNLLVFSEGDAAEHRELGLRSPLILDPDFKTAEKLGMFGTPSAILIDEEGNYVSETAVGAVNIWSLVGREV